MSWRRYMGLGVLSFFVSSFSLADERENFYLALEGHYVTNNIESGTDDKADFSMTSYGLRFGYYVQPQLGIELYGALGANDDSDLGIEMNLESSAGILGRFESPETEDGFKLFVLLGYGVSELEMKRSSASLPDRELYHGFVYGGGAEIRLGESNSYINIQGLRHYDEDDISLDGISLGFRQGF